jgi:hypothetical protein
MEGALKIALAFVLGALLMLVAVNLVYNNPAASSLISPSYCPMMGSTGRMGNAASGGMMGGNNGDYCPMKGGNTSGCGH